MTSSAFERYRQASAARSSLPWLLAGSLIVAICWLLATGAVIYGGAYLYAYVGPIFGPEPLTFDQGGFTSRFLASPIGVISTLLTFAGVWLGVGATLAESTAGVANGELEWEVECEASMRVRSSISSISSF